MFGGILFITLVLEIAVLTYLEYVSWKTIYTPLCCLMLPYLFVLLITVAIAGNFGFVEFYYPSLVVWIMGLMIFAIPSYAFSLIYTKRKEYFTSDINEIKLPTVLIVLSFLLCALFFLRLLGTLSSSVYLFGTDDFAEEFSGHGIWAHLRVVLMPLLILFIFSVNKKKWWLWPVIIGMLVVQFVYMVKGVIIIAVVAGLTMRLYSGKMHLTLSFVTKLLSGGFAIFLLMYMVLPLLGKGNMEADSKLFDFVAEHFLHYFTSGTLGYSYDLQLGCPDRGDFEMVVSPFVNLYKAAVGDKDVVFSLNKYYLNTGISYTNVRTFFGTLDIYTDMFQFLVYILVASGIMYGLKLFAMYTGNIFVYIVLFYYCGLMAMGWFEFYLFHLAVIEVPMMSLLLWLMVKFIGIPKTKEK